MRKSDKDTTNFIPNDRTDAIFILPIKCIQFVQKFAKHILEKNLQNPFLFH